MVEHILCIEGGYVQFLVPSAIRGYQVAGDSLPNPLESCCQPEKVLLRWLTDASTPCETASFMFTGFQAVSLRLFFSVVLRICSKGTRCPHENEWMADEH